MNIASSVLLGTVLCVDEQKKAVFEGYTFSVRNFCRDFMLKKKKIGQSLRPIVFFLSKKSRQRFRTEKVYRSNTAFTSAYYKKASE